MKSLFLWSTLVFAVIFFLPMGLFAEKNTDDGPLISHSIMPVSSYNGELQTGVHNQNYGRCQLNYALCLNIASNQVCSMLLNVCFAGCEIDTISRGNLRGTGSCYQEE